MPWTQRPHPEMLRREFLQAGTLGLGALAGLDRLVPTFARAQAGFRPGDGVHQGPVDLSIDRTTLPFAGRAGQAVTVNGSVPGPLLRFREGDMATLRVTNRLAEDTSIHWHGILLPPDMDGVPGVSFPGISPGETFEYHFPIKQTGTYWYHSHSGMQEQSGVYGPLIIDPRGPDPVPSDREHVIVLSDWTFEDPHRVIAKLKKMAGYYNHQRRTVGDLFREVSQQGLGAALGDRLMWGRMRMDPTDIADVTSATYTYLMNGMAPESNWTGLFRPGERVRLRFINGSGATFFDVRIPGLRMTVIAADGQAVEPVVVDEFRIGNAETYDVIVEPETDQGYTIFAETMDRSGYARGTLAPRTDMIGELPARRQRPVRTMADMGMDMSGMDMADMEGHEGHDMGAPGVRHAPGNHGPGNSMVAEISSPRLDDPGVGLGGDGRQVLRYSDLRSVSPWYDEREPERDVELHLTGNMERYMWSFDGKKFSQAPEAIGLQANERVRLILVNDTMMEHPIHLHGMWMQLDNGLGQHNPLKHTVIVKPAERVSLLITADAVGRWAFHCHILYHMDMGMFRVVEVFPPVTAEEGS